MLNLKLSPDVQLCEKFTDYVYKGDNKISEFTIELPEKVGAGYKTRECDIEMRCYLPDGDYMSYMLDTSTLRPTQLITNDITEEPQSVEIMFIITHGEDVIGKSNSVTLYVLDAPDAGEPLVPRGEADKVIKAQRQTIATQRLTIEEQTEQIEQDSETIGSLNNQVEELTSENEELSEQNAVYLDTIDELNKRVPAMETPLPVTPTGETQVIRPSENYAGLASVTVDRVTAAADPDIQPENIKEGVEILGVEGSYNPFPEQSYGGVYILKKNEDGYPERVLIKDYFAGGADLVNIFPTNNSNIKANLKELLIKNVSSLTRINTSNLLVLKTLVVDAETVIPGYGLDNCPALETLLAYKVTTFGTTMVRYCISLKTVHIPNSLISIEYDTFTAYPSSKVLEHVTIEPGFNCNNLNLSNSTLYSVETIVSWLEALADRTGETAYTLTMGATNLNKLTDEQKAIAIGKNWNLA